jgi:hypothetical protein
MRNVAECPRRGVPKACCSDEGPGAEETACGHGPGLGVAGSGTFEASPEGVKRAFKIKIARLVTRFR